MPWIQFSLAIILSSSDFQVKTPTSYPCPCSPSPSTSQALSLPHSWVWKLHLSSPSCNAHQSRPHTCVPPHSQHPCQYHKELEPKITKVRASSSAALWPVQSAAFCIAKGIFRKPWPTLQPGHTLHLTSPLPLCLRWCCRKERRREAKEDEGECKQPWLTVLTRKLTPNVSAHSCRPSTKIPYKWVLLA